MEIPLCRLRQIIEASHYRIEDGYRRTAKLAEWQAKTICVWIGANAGVWMDLDKGKKNPLIEAVTQIDVFGLPDTIDKDLEAMRGERVADNWEDDPRFSKAQADPDKGIEAANPPGSMEAFLHSFGVPPGSTS